MNIQPQNTEVSWPADEGVIGVVGVAPWATLDFCGKVYELCPASKDWHYPRVLVDANSKIPSRGRHLELGEADPSPFIRGTIEELAAAGATVAVVPCNTAHILYTRWADDSVIPVINIIDATVSVLSHRLAMTVAVLSSRYLSDSGIYQRHLASSGHTPVELAEAQQDVVSRCIERLKQNPSLDAGVVEEMSSLVKSLQHAGTDAVILACTELGLLNGHSLWGNLIVVDSNVELARAALQAVGINNTRQERGKA